MKKLYMFSVVIFDSDKYVTDADVVSTSIKRAKEIAVTRIQARYPEWTVSAKAAYKKYLVVA